MIDDLEGFRLQFRSWLADNVPSAWRREPFPRNWPPADDDPAGVAQCTQWHHRLADGGWLAPGWPVEYGGRGLLLRHRMVMTEELAAARAPTPIGFQGVDTLGPALIAFGTDHQRQRFLPRIVTAEDLWCQGYSEPNAGSDLASISTRAVRRGDNYVVSGQKVWTSYGGRATWCFLLVRTGSVESRHKGITFLLTETSVPGLDWRPIRQLAGGREFGELFLDEVKIPVSQTIGRENGGWAVAMHSLSHERLLAGNVAPIRARMNALIELSRGRTISPVQRQRVAELEGRVRTAAGLQGRALLMADRGDSRFSAWASLVKLASTELRLAIAEEAVAILGAHGQTRADPLAGAIAPDDLGGVWTHELLDGRAATLYAGTSEIQRNIIAETGLGLPRN